MRYPNRASSVPSVERLGSRKTKRPVILVQSASDTRMQGVAAHKTEDSISAVKKVASQPTEEGLCDEARRKSKVGELVRATGDSQSMAPYSKAAETERYDHTFAEKWSPGTS